MCCDAEIHKTSAELFFVGTNETQLFKVSVKMPFKSLDQLHVSVWHSWWLSVNLHVLYKLTQMLETCWYESLQGRAGYIIYTYCMYTIKLKALILSIVFNYLRFLMMKIDCTKLFFFILCLCMSPEQMKTLWMVHQHSRSHTTVAVHPGVKKKRHFCSLLPIMNAQIKHL